MATQRHHFDLFADYHQFYLQDERVDGNLGDSWTQEATDRLLAMTDGTIGVGTVRNMTVPVDVEVLDAEPRDPFDEWDQINECSIDVKSGRIVVAGCTDYLPDAARIQVPPGMYRARIYYGKLDALSENGLEGEDHYRVVLWPGDETPPVVLKARPFRGGR
ncbi:MAG TPA: hypothetical protein VH253_01655 [Phycisphaerae bacterium]|nr:hypothetical protein [Phycisphaerae bacterium]